MSGDWEIDEGVLRGKRKPDGSWEFVQFVVFDAAKGPEEFPLSVSTPSEARKIASETERRELQRYAEYRRHHHIETSFNEGGWVGDILEKPSAKFLIDEFELEVECLSNKQRSQLEQDVLSIDYSFLTAAKQRAKAERTITRKAIVQLRKQQKRIESLSRAFRTMAHFSPFAAPDETLAQLIFELSENEKAIGENLNELGQDKSNLSAVSLCTSAIDLFLRWADEAMPMSDRGLRYSPNYAALKRLPKITSDKGDSIPAEFGGPLGEFIEELQYSLADDGLLHWKFGVHEPARKALAQHEKRSQFLN